jgi:hypothetical protein
MMCLKQGAKETIMWLIAPATLLFIIPMDLFKFLGMKRANLSASVPPRVVLKVIKMHGLSETTLQKYLCLG